MAKILITEFLDEVALPILKASGAEVLYDPTLFKRPEAIKDLAADVAALIVRNQTKVSRELLAALPALRVVGRLGVGLDNLDLPALRERRITVCAARSANAIAVAEYVMAAMMTAARRLVSADASTREGNWDRQGFTGLELHGRTLGIIGVGDIGLRLAIRAAAFGMRVIGYDPLLPPFNLGADELNVRLTSLDEVVTTADFISLHVPLLPTTRGLFGAERLAAMKPGAWLINTARGGIIDEAALAEALTAGGGLGGAVLDVFEQEPPTASHPLRKVPHCIMTPHVAGLTKEAGLRVAEMTASDVVRALSGAQPFGLVSEFFAKEP